MKLIVGLGNPGKEYENTRHNFAWRVVDAFAEKLNLKFRTRPNVAVTPIDKSLFSFPLSQAEVPVGVLLAKPLTYMNNSGIAVSSLVDLYKLPLTSVIVICDDFSIPFATVRIRKQGSAGGHNGLTSIIQSLGTNEFPRLRIGIGPVPARYDPKDFVLTAFTKQEKEQLPEIIGRCLTGLETILTDGIDKAMSLINQIKPENPK